MDLAILGLDESINQFNELIKRNTTLLSIIYMVKDEPENLRASLESTKGLADFAEIIVCDTGEPDFNSEILNIANEFGARQIWYRFTNFSEVRNYLIDCAYGKWILFVDADETIICPDINLFKTMLEETPGSCLAQQIAITRDRKSVV
jgi:glycosyltransferase involved in cell wall biosynthesis